MPFDAGYLICFVDSELSSEDGMKQAVACCDARLGEVDDYFARLERVKRLVYERSLNHQITLRAFLIDQLQDDFPVTDRAAEIAVDRSISIFGLATMTLKDGFIGVSYPHLLKGYLDQAKVHVD